MAALEKVLELQREGMGDEQIIEYLRHQGISPKDINDAINHAKIKSAVSENQSQEQYPQENQQYSPEQGQEYYQQAPEGYPQYQDQQVSPQEQYPPEQYPQEQQDLTYQDPNFYQPPAPQTEQPNYYAQTPQAYSGSSPYPESQSIDSEKIAEIAEQVFYEKSGEFIKETKDISTLKNDLKNRIEDLDLRLKRIEDSIEKLQNAIISKVGEFGQNTSAIHHDLENLHGTVSKLMNPLTDTYKELRKIAKKD